MLLKSNFDKQISDFYLFETIALLFFFYFLNRTQILFCFVIYLFLTGHFFLSLFNTFRTVRMNSQSTEIVVNCTRKICRIFKRVFFFRTVVKITKKIYKPLNVSVLLYLCDFL